MKSGSRSCGLANTKKLLQDIKAGKAKYHFVEVMACPRLHLRRRPTPGRH